MAIASRRPPRVFYILTPVLAILLTLAATELVLALLFPVPFAAESNMYYVADPHTGFRLAPNSTGRFAGGITAHVNSHGHRDDEIPLERRSGVPRVLVLGDSFTMGASVADDETYAQVLEALLTVELGADVEVLNAGVGAWSPYQYAEYYEHHGWRFAADVVVVGFFVGNDSFSQVRALDHTRTAIMGRRVDRGAAQERPRSTRFKLWIYLHSHLGRVVMNRRTLVIGKLRSGSDELRDAGEFTPQYLAIQRRRMERNHLAPGPATESLLANALTQITRLRDLVHARQARLLVVLIPDENQVNRSLAEAVQRPQDFDYDLTMPQRLLVPLFEDQDLDVLDLLGDFRSDPRRLYMNDTHWSPDGHRLAAERISKRVRGLLGAGSGGAPSRQ